MDLGSIKGTEIEVTRTSPTKHAVARLSPSSRMLCSSIDSKRNLLLIPTTPIEQLKSERHHSHYFRLSFFQEQACFAWLTRH